MRNGRADNLDEYSRYKYVIENIKDVIWEADENLIFTFISAAIKGMTGYNAQEMEGKCLFDFLTPKSKVETMENLRQGVQKRISCTDKNTAMYDIEFICKGGKTIWCEVCAKPVFGDAGFTGYIGTTRDISDRKALLEELKRKNDQLEAIVTFDMLTGTYNRRKFGYFTGLEVEKKEKYGSPFSIIMFDVDDFKEINDYYGHKKGDKVLQDITAIIKRTLRATDKLFRWGGDEFILLLPELTLKHALKVANKVREAIRAFDFDIGGRKVTVSLGAADYALSETQDQLVSRADHAMLKAKFNGKDKVEQG